MDTVSITNEKIKLPKYSLSEELMNSISHGVGAIFGVVVLILCIIKSASTGDPFKIVSSIVYGVSLIILYSISCIYHSLKRNRGKKVLRVLDHCSVFILIIGTYTPFSLVMLRSYSDAWGFIIFGIVWALGILGITLNAISIEKFKTWSMISYLAMGWTIIFALKPLITVFSGTGLLLLVLGGVIYTLGAALYGIGSKVKYMHSIFHFFVLAGSVLQFISIYLYVL